MKNKKYTRSLSLLLCTALLMCYIPTTVFAATEAMTCENHPTHNDDCGYMEAEPGQPCQHQHTKECYTDELICGLDDEEAPTATDSDATTVHKHTQECYRMDCPHEHGKHDDTCGYVEAVPESPCNHSCELCGDKDSDHTVNNGLMPPVSTMSNAVSINSDDYSFNDGTLTITTDAGTTAWRDSIDKTAVTKIVVKEGVTRIGHNAFRDCENLEQAELPSSVISIGNNMFSDCVKLAQVKLPSNLKSIGYCMFSGCENLALEKLPSDLKSIEWKAFYHCYNLELEELPSGVTSIGGAAFQGCVNLALKSPPDNVTTIEDYAFQGCVNLALENLPNDLTSIGEMAFSGCGKLVLEELPRKLNSIAKGAFGDCTKLALKALPSGVTTIGVRAFSGCENLTLKELPSSVTTIEDYAFADCSKIALEKLPSGVKSIGSRAFEGCTNLTSLTIPRSDAPSLGEDAFWRTNLTTIFVPAGATGYTAANNWPTDKLVFGAYLKDISIIGYDLTPAFFAGTENYTVFVPDNTNHIWVTADGTGTIILDGLPIILGYKVEIPLEDGKDKKFEIVVKNSETDKRIYTITVTRKAVFVPVNDIVMTNATAVQAGNDLLLTTTVMPDTATNKTIVWSVADANGTGAVITGSTFKATAAGTATIKATIKNGQSASDDYTKTFNIEVTPEPDTTKPTVSTISPSGTGITVSGDIQIVFSETMDTTAGNVTLSVGSGIVNGPGSWNEDKVTYTIGYSGLAYDTDYTIQISGFKDAAGNVMDNDSGHRFKTEVAPHVHTPGTTWMQNDTEHWHECIAGDGEKLDIAVHTSSDWIVDKEATASQTGSKHKECTICKFVMATESIPATGSGSSSGSSSGTRRISTSTTVPTVKWILDEKGWRLKNPDQTWAMSGWKEVNGIWYHFNEEGYMQTGWFTDLDGNKYYLSPDEGSTQGGMVIGWQLIENKWYYFNMISDGTKGRLLFNTVTPDGYTVGADGVWNSEE
ncbi:MAG: leucine-rich repeat protein [Clostridiales bacterium]|nr:leucine-rich repeat protein [Clostridiales bacterium]